MSEPCWCGGGYAGYGKHRNRVRKTEPCADSQRGRAAYYEAYRAANRERINELARRRVKVNGVRRTWSVGSDIDLSDDAL